MAAEGVEQLAMRAGVHQRAVVVLAVDLHQRAADALHQRHAGRLVVDEDARAPVGRLQPPQDDVAFVVYGVLGQQRAGGMVARHVEHGRHLPLGGAMAHERRIAARAERQRQRVEQDGLAGARLAGQHRQAR